jgi:hypothetical protein
MIDLLPARVTRAFGSEFTYSETLSHVHKFNERFLRERRMRLRLPFVDSQTNIIQTPTSNHLWKQAVQRLPPSRDDQIASYARQTWQKKRAHQPKSTASTSAHVSSQPVDPLLTKEVDINDEKSMSNDDDPRILLQAGELGRLFCNCKVQK